MYAEQALAQDDVGASREHLSPEDREQGRILRQIGRCVTGWHLFCGGAQGLKAINVVRNERVRRFSHDGFQLHAG